MDMSNMKSVEHLDTNFCEQDILDNTSGIMDDNILSNSNTGNQLSGNATTIKSGGGGGTDTLQRFFRRKQQTAGASPTSLKLEKKQQPSDDLTSEEQGNIGDNKIIENVCDTTAKKLSMESGGETDGTAGTAAAVIVAAAAVNIENVQKTSSLNRIFSRKSSVTMSDKNDKKKQNKCRPQTSSSENDSSTQQKSRK